MNDNQSTGVPWGILAPLAILLAVGLVVVLAVLGITDNQATAAQAQARIAHEQTAQVQAREDARTERWQSFILGLKALTVDGNGRWPFIPALLVSIAALIASVALFVRVRQQKEEGE